ncbi:uncharacterized protein MAL13P1.304-like isoform X2 [Leptopilina boulardi]|uniref:uncharacterized protein MAL13P1.304-like isoform X2 n=1 Tax=Leptopilina boulardi TaxID=63433 RepID=UPI0021F613DF|nr:uncharacterized protein MAL13P1.304-like isoform X2 [Leptopilina boulardi]
MKTMTKHRIMESQGKKIKRKDSSDSSGKISLKYKEIIKNQPIVLLEKLVCDSSLISNTPNKVSLKLVSTPSHSQLSQKKFNKYLSSSAPSTSKKYKVSSRCQNYLEKKDPLSLSFISTEGSLDEELSKYGGGFGKSRSKFKGTVCTRDPMRLTPCSDACCIQFSNTDDKKKNKKDSNSKKISKSQPTFHTSIKTKLNSSQKSTTDSTSKQNRLKDEKSRINKCDTKIDNNLLSSDENSQGSFTSSNRVAIFMKKKNPPSSSSSQPTQNNSNNNNNNNNINSPLNFYLTPSNSSIKSSNSCNTNLLINRGTKQRSEYFPNLSIDNLCRSETKTNYPKVVIPKKTQTKMLEAATFPKTSGPNIETSFKTKLLYTQSNMSYVSPLGYQENELRITQTDNNNKMENYQKIKENHIFPHTSFNNQNVNYQENNFLMNNQIENRITTNDIENSFRNLAFERIPENGTCLSEMKLNENICNFQQDNAVPSSSNNDFHQPRVEEAPFVSQLSYSESHVRESSLSNIEKEEFLMEDFNFPILSFDKIINTIDHSIGISNSENNLQPPPSSPMTSSQKKNIKIKDIETIPSNCIQIIPRSKPIVKTENNLSQENNDSIKNGLNGEKEKVAIINIQNLEQLRKDEIIHNQDLYDYNIIGEELINNYLPTTQDEHALVNSSIVDPNNDLLHLFCDDFLNGDIVNNNGNNNEKSNQISSNSLDIKVPFSVEPLPSSSNEVLHLYDPSGRSCVIPVTNEFKEPLQNLNTSNEKINNENNDDCQRKRKWFDKKRKCHSEPGAKKVKLNRRKWSRTCNESDDFTDTSSEVSSSCTSSFYENDNINNTSHDNLESLNINQNEHNDETKLNPSIVTNTLPIEINQKEIETNLIIEKNIEIQKHEVAVEKSLVDPEPQPEPEQEELKIPLNHVHEKIRYSPSRLQLKQNDKPPLERKKKRKRNSKFSPTSFSSDSSSDDEYGCNKGNSSSDDERELEDKLKRRFQQELSHIQSGTNNIDNNDKESLKSLNSPMKDDQKEDDAISLYASPSLMDISRCTTPLPDSRATQSDFSNNDDSFWDAYMHKQEVELECDLKRYRERCNNERNKENETKDKEKMKQEDLFTRPVRNIGKTNSNVRINNIKSRLGMSSTSNVNNSKTQNSIRTKIEAPSTSNNNDRSTIVKTKIEAPNNNNSHGNNIKSNIEIPSTLNTNVNNFTTKISAEQNFDVPYLSRSFNGLCYTFLIRGQCIRNLCPFEHKIPERLQYFPNVPELAVYNLMNDCIIKKYQYYLLNVYTIVMSKFSYYIALKFFNDMLDLHLINVPYLESTIEILKQKLIPLSTIVHDLLKIIPINNILLKTLFVFADQKSLPNEYWETMRNFIWKTGLTNVILEKILHQCLNDSQNIERINEVYKVFIDNHLNERVNKELWVGFCNVLYLHLNENSIRQNVVHNEPIINDIASPDLNYQTPVHEQIELNHENVQESIVTNSETIQQPIETNLKNDNTYSVSRIDLTPQKPNQRNEDLFWKFYDRLESLKRGLQHNDYKYVVNILKEFVGEHATEKKTIFSRHCHHVLCEEINKSKTHVENVIKIAVQDGELSKMREILSQLGTNVLIELADRELWVYANELLKTLQKYELYNNNAGLTLLAAEIYLANHFLSEAFWLLRESNIIFTNCASWKVKSNKEDSQLRISVVTLLLEALCQNHAQEAFFIFDLILGEQQSNSYPINLTRIVDRLMLSLLEQDRMDNVINFCKKAMRYHLNFHDITYRTIITALVPIDIDLARQFFQYASHLGVYTTSNAYPVTCVITNMDWSEEEMYLVISEFLRKLSMDAGIAISHIGNRQLSASFVLEAIPSRKQLYNDISDENNIKTNGKKLKKSKAMLKNILETRFDPPITIVKKEQVSQVTLIFNSFAI